MRYFRPYSRRVYRKRGYRKHRGTYRKKGSGLRKMVKKIINRKIETKEYALVTAQNIYEQNSYTGAVSQTLNLIPAMTQGTGNGRRIGDKLTVSSFKLKSIVTLSQPGANGHFVRAVVYSIKDYQADTAGATLPSIEMQNFFRINATTGPPAGYLGTEGMAPINTNRIVVHYDKLHFLGTNVVPVNSSSGHTNGGDSGRPFIKFNWSMKKSQVWKFDDNAVNSTLPINHNLFLTIFCVDAGNAYGSGATQIASNINWCDIKYKDA